MKITTIFSNKTGNAENYRIPSMLVAKNGAIVAVADERFFSGGDNPNRIDKVVRISHDSGETWEAQKTIVEEIGESKLHSSAAIDPALLLNHNNGEIFLLYSHTPAGIGILNCKQSKGLFNGHIIVRDGNKLHYIKNNEILAKSGAKTGYSVDQSGNIYSGASSNKQKQGNIKVGSGKFMEEKTAFLMLCKSTDNGESWSQPVHLNDMVKKPGWGFIGAGPGIGICIKNGKFAGRLVFPIYFGSHKLPPSCNAAAMFSDDNGATWQRGNAVVEDRREKWYDFINWLNYSKWLTETQLIELDNGDLMIFVRNHNKKRRIATAISKDGGASWQNYTYREELSHPICQISVIKFKHEGKSCVLTLNAHDTAKRQNGTLHLSEDDGSTFSYSRQLVPGEFVYSSMALLPDGNIGILFEGETTHTKIDFIKVSLDWIKGKE